MEKIFNAKTFEEAKAKASEEFGIDELDIHFEIIEQPVKKLFGTKGEFRVRAFFEDAVKPEVKNAPPKTAAAVKEKSPVVKKPAVEKTKSVTLSAEEAGKFKNVVEYLGNVLNKLGVEGFTISVKADGPVNILDISGENLGVIIGRRGETLDSLQYLAILANNRAGDEEHSRITVDCNGYREKRAETLEHLASRTSTKVLKQGRRITLEPMNPYERRIIHSKVSEIDGVYSNSIGDEPYRKVVISAEIPKKRPFNERGGRSPAPRGNSARPASAPVSRSYKQSSEFSTSFEREYKRTPGAVPEISQDTVDVEKNTSLYGKIEL